ARRTELLAQWATMLGVNAVRQGPDDEAHIRKVLEFPENDDPIDGPEEDPEEDPEEKDEERDEEIDEAKMSQEQQIGDFLDATEDKLRTELSAIMERSRDKLIILVEAKRPQRELLSFEIPQARIREAVGRSMVSVFERGAVDLKREVKAEFDIGKALKDAKAAIRQIKARAFEVARNIQAEISAAVRRVILDGNDLGDLDQGTVGQIKEAFQQWVDTSAIDPQTQKEIKKEANRLATIARTEATDSYNRGRLVAARDPALKAFIVGMKSNAILDENTTEVCRFLDGKVFLIDDPDLDNLRPPRHANCRSWYTPVFDRKDLLSSSEIGKAKELAG
ncbi:MAG: minor capsid protein, partial [Nitrososphaera sp.]|nr:minor capsid protein [Nitrososphaera sp.]